MIVASLFLWLCILVSVPVLLHAFNDLMVVSRNFTCGIHSVACFLFSQRNVRPTWI